MALILHLIGGQASGYKHETGTASSGFMRQDAKYIIICYMKFVNGRLCMIPP